MKVPLYDQPFESGRAPEVNCEVDLRGPNRVLSSLDALLPHLGQMAFIERNLVPQLRHWKVLVLRINDP